jgi:hypothetical protein
MMAGQPLSFTKPSARLRRYSDATGTITYQAGIVSTDDLICILMTDFWTI